MVLNRACALQKSEAARLYQFFQGDPGLCWGSLQEQYQRVEPVRMKVVSRQQTPPVQHSINESRLKKLLKKESIYGNHTRG